MRLKEVKSVLEENNFSAFVVDNLAEARSIVMEELIPKIKPESISWGGSVTFSTSGIYDDLKNSSDYKILDTYDAKLTAEEKLEKRRQALLVDLFFAGTNAVTETGKLINLDMVGNRVGAITFGPKNVVILVGRNKIVADVDEAILRIKQLAAPANTVRLKMKNPCLKTGYCEECKSRERICNTWTIHEKSFPKGRINVVLINEDLGL